MQLNEPSSSPSRIPASYLLLGLVVPTAITWMYFVWLSESSPAVQQLAFGLGKGIQFAVLIVALFIWLKKDTIDSLGIKRVRLVDWFTGATTGLLIGGLIGSFYFFVLLPIGVMEPVKEQASEKLTAFGGKSPLVFAAITLFYALLHSGFEELYWRAFLFRGLARSNSMTLAIAISSLGFMAHHVLVLGKLFGYQTMWTYVCSLGVAVGGIIWALLINHTKSLIPSWLSHGIVDAAIFAVGYHLVFCT